MLACRRRGGSDARSLVSVALRTVGAVEVLRGGCVVCRAAGPALCPVCLRRTSPPPTTQLRGVGPVIALFAYEGHGARIVQALKYRDGRRLVGPLADHLAARCRPAAPDVEVVTWVPTSGRRRRSRGFDQSELLARAVARRLDVPVRALLHRRPGPAQTGLGREGRAATAGYEPRRCPAASVLVVDDVCTTGATARAAVGALRSAGAVRVAAAVVARTP